MAPHREPSSPAAAVPAAVATGAAEGSVEPTVLAVPSVFARPPVEVIFLNRAGFGPRPGDVERVRAMGVAAYLEEQLHPETIDDSSCDARVAAVAPRYQSLTLAELWARRTLPDTAEFWKARDEARTITWLRAIYSRRQLYELLVDHWHNHFNVYSGAYPIYLLWPDHDRRIRRNVFGNFRVFLEEIATSPAMLYYLDNSSNQLGGPNENFSRELLELHTLGVTAYRPGVASSTPDGYTDADVREVARCFTGWTLRNRSWDPAFGDTSEFFYYAPWHDTGAKTVLGTTIPANQPPLKDGRDVLDLLARHPATARQVATRLARRLVADEPSASLVEAGARAYLDHLNAPDQLRHVVRALLSHPDASTVWGEKIRRPFEALVAFLRATEAEWRWTDYFAWQVSRAGQPLWEWSAPNGYPDERTAWLGSTQLTARWSVFNALAENLVDGTTTSLAAKHPPGITTPRQIAGYWVERLLGYRPPEAEWWPLVEFVARGRNPDVALPSDLIAKRIHSLAALVLQLPAAQLR